MLIDAGADPTIKNKDGKKPIDLAEDSNQQVIDILQSAELALQVSPDGTLICLFFLPLFSIFFTC